MKVRLLMAAFVICGLALIAGAVAGSASPPPDQAVMYSLQATSPASAVMPVAPAVKPKEDLQLSDPAREQFAMRQIARSDGDPDPIPTCGLPGQPACQVRPQRKTPKQL